MGGRYSALSHFGLLPAALAGADIRSLLDRGASMANRCFTDTSAEENPGALLGAAMGALAKEGRDKLTLIASPSVAPFGMWLDQLIAESTGKDGMGIVPIVNEPLMPTEYYGDDRLFVYLRKEGDGDHEVDETVNDLRDHSHPVIVINLGDTHDLGAEFFRWEFATAVAASILGVHPFDQPNVQASKEQTLEVLEEIEGTGDLPKTDPTGSIEDLLLQARTDDYLAIMAYVQPTPETEAALTELRRDVTERCKIATTLGIRTATAAFDRPAPQTWAELPDCSCRSLRTITWTYQYRARATRSARLQRLRPWETSVLYSGCGRRVMCV